MAGAASIERDGSPRNGPSYQIRAGFDAIWNDVVIASVQLTDAFDRDDIRPGATMRAPRFTRNFARSEISGSFAAFSMTVVPRARDAAIIRFSVPVTVGVSQ